MAEELYLNNEQVFLPERSVALTSQINNIAELKDRQADYSNKIKIPKTPENIVTMDMLGVAGNQSRKPYTEVSVKYVIDGIEKISNGKGIIKNTDNYYNLVIYDGNISIINLLGNSTMQDLDLTAYDHDLTQSNYFASFSATSGYIYGLGKFYEDATDGIIDINLQGVSFYIHTLFNKIFEEVGFTISGDLLTNGDYLSRVISMNTGYDRSSVADKSTVNTDSTPRSEDDTFGTTLTLENYLIHTYTALTDSIFNINVTGVLDVTHGNPAVVIVRKNTTVLINSIIITDTSTFNLDAEVQAIAGDELQVFVSIVSVVPFGDGIQHIKFDANPITTTYKTNAVSIPIEINALIDDMKQIDFIKDIMQHFGAIYRRTRNSDNYEFKLMETLLFDKDNAEDWSDKYVSVTNESYTSPYAQSNLLKYKYDTPEAESEEDPTFADGDFLIDDLNLPLEKPMFTSNFKASESDGTHYVLKQWVDNSDDEIEANIDGMRMFKISIVNDSITYRYSPDVTGVSVFSGDLPFLDFTDVDYDSEVELYYRGIYSMLNDYRKITVNCNLSVIDNYELDFFKLKYIKQLGQYYYLNKVRSFKKDKVTKVELVEINEFTPEIVPEEVFVARLVTDTIVTASLTLTQPDSLVANLVTDTIVTAILDLSNVSDQHNNFFNGTFLETFDALITEAGGVVTMTLTNAAGGDLTMRFSDGYTVLSTPVTIDLTVGTDSAQQQNWIYIPKSAKVLTKSTSSWLNAEHIKVGFFFCQSAASVQSAGGTIINQNINDEGGLSDDLQGHMSGMALKLRALRATYFSGVDPNGTTSYLTITAGNVEFKSTAGINIQMHPQIFPEFDTSISSIMHIKNWSGDPYHPLTNLHDITADSTGTTIGNNKWFNIVFWGVQNKSGEHQTIIGNLSSGFYSRQVDAEHDALGYNDFTMPREFNIDSSTGFLIVLITVKMASTWVFGSAINLRSITPQIASGGVSGISSSFVDSQFNIFNVADDTKDLMFDLSNIATATTRTLTVQDADGTIALLSDVSTPDLQAVTTEGATTSNTIRAISGAFLEAFTSSSQYGRLAVNALTLWQGASYNMILTVSTGDLKVKFNSTFSLILQFPTVASSNKTQTYQDKTGTIALLSDITAGVTNLSTTHNATTVVIESDTGNNATINGATALLAGVVTNADQTFGGNKTLSKSSNPTLQLRSTDTTLSIGDLIGSLEFYKSDTDGGGAGVPLKIIGRSVGSGDNFSMRFFTGSVSALVLSLELDETGNAFILGDCQADNFKIISGNLSSVSSSTSFEIEDLSGADEIAIKLEKDGITFKNNNPYLYIIRPPSPITGGRVATFPDKGGKVGIIGTVAPASASATGVVGEIRVTSTFTYTCIATDTWVRSVAATW